MTIQNSISFIQNQSCCSNDDFEQHHSRLTAGSSLYFITLTPVFIVYSSVVADSFPPML